MPSTLFYLFIPSYSYNNVDNFHNKIYFLNNTSGIKLALLSIS